MLDDPVPINYGNPGCPAMVRRGAGQWTSCGGEPVVVGYVGGRGGSGTGCTRVPSTASSWRTSSR